MEDEISPKDMYTKLQKQYKLPPFPAMNKEFELSTIEAEEAFFLRHVAKKMEERLNFFQSIFGDVLNPDLNSAAVMQESQFFDDAQKESLFVTFQKLMRDHRLLLLAEAANDDTQYVEVINVVWKNYDFFKNEAQVLLKKLKETWEVLSDPKEELNYLG